MKWFATLVLILSVTAWGVEKKKIDPELPAPKEAGELAGHADEVVKGKSLVHTIKLESYLKDLKSDEFVEKMDSQGKNNPDIFVVYKKNDDGSRLLIMQLFDLNRDGKIDLVKHFEKGKLVKTEIDLDYDGYVDVVSEYDPISGELKRKIQADGATNIWKYYFKNELRKKEVDRNSDGKPDMWVYYRNGKVVRTEIDKDFNGKIVRIEGPLNPTKDKKGKGAASTQAD